MKTIISLCGYIIMIILVSGLGFSILSSVITVNLLNSLTTTQQKEK